jgi:hypothetical protein
MELERIKLQVVENLERVLVGRVGANLLLTDYEAFPIHLHRGLIGRRSLRSFVIVGAEESPLVSAWKCVLCPH